MRMPEVSGRPFVHSRWVALRQIRNLLVKKSNRIILGFRILSAHFDVDESVAIFCENRAHVTLLSVLNILRKSAHRGTHVCTRQTLREV